jgi:DNA-binding NarL/FixJ family response regulator
VISLLLVDDHEVVRMGLRSLLEQTEDIHVTAEAATAAEAVAQARASRPDVVLLDVRLPDGDGVEVCRTIRDELPGTRVLMLTSYADDEALFSAIMAGAAGYLLKQVRGRALVDAIRAVAAGQSLLDPAMTQAVLERLRSPARANDRFAELTDQERTILDLVAQGKTNREIGAQLYLSDKTVKHYVSNILGKLQVARRSEAAALWAREHPHGAGRPEGS